MNKTKSKLTLAIISLFLLLTTLSLNEIAVHAATTVSKGEIISGGELALGIETLLPGFGICLVVWFL